MLLYNVTFHVVIDYSPPLRKRIQWNPKNGFLMMYLVLGKIFFVKGLPNVISNSQGQRRETETT